MITFEEAGRVLDEAVDSLPREIFEKLNGGVSLLPDTRYSDDGLLTMGMYIVDQMGRRVELYYGSFAESFPEAADEEVRRELVHTLKHELTHHLENLAGDRSLELWDDQHRAELLAELGGEPLRAESILFVSRDSAGLAPMAEALFRLAASRAALPVRCASAGLNEAREEVNPKAAQAAAAYGANLQSIRLQALSRALLEACDVALCMTEEEAAEAAARFPDLEEKIMCIGPRDISPPRMNSRGGWDAASAKIAEEIEYLIAELTEDGHGNADS